MTPLDIMIEGYIIKCTDTIVMMEEWENLSIDELYYIRNGILAYCGQFFESHYYDKFSWYSGNVSEEDVWNHVNSYQLENIDNIKSVEKQKRENKD